MKILAILIGFLFSYQLHAECRCSCINGQSRNICSNSYDLQQNCGIILCPVPPTPLVPKRPGARTIPLPIDHPCQSIDVYQQKTDTYEWQIYCK